MVRDLLYFVVGSSINQLDNVIKLVQQGKFIVYTH